MIPCIFLLTLVQVQNSSNNVRVVVNGESFMAPAHIRRNRVQVAMRPIFERLGAYLQYDPTVKKVVATRESQTMTLLVGESFAYDFGNRRVVLDYPAMIANGRVMVPLRFVGESLGVNVKWDPATRTATIDSAKVSP